MTRLWLEDRDERRPASATRAPLGSWPWRSSWRWPEAVRARRLIDIESAHIDGCLPFGRWPWTLPQRLLEGGGQCGRTDDAQRLRTGPAPSRACRPATPRRQRSGARSLPPTRPWAASPTWTCAPYQLAQRPAYGHGTSPGQSRMPSSSPTRCSAHEPAATATSSTSAPRSTGRVPEAGLHVGDEPSGPRRVPAGRLQPRAAGRRPALSPARHPHR